MHCKARAMLCHVSPPPSQHCTACLMQLLVTIATGKCSHGQLQHISWRVP